MPTSTSPTLVNDLQRDILDNRARLIDREARLSREIDRQIGEIHKKWLAQVKRQLRKQNLSATDLSQLRNRVELLNRAGLITKSTLDQVQTRLREVVGDTFKSEAYRHTQILDSYTIPKDVSQGISFTGINRRAMVAAQSNVLPGRSMTKAFSSINSSVRRAMKKDLSEAIANGWKLDDLAKKWSKRAGPGASGVIRSEANKLARTAMMAASTRAQEFVFEQNPDVVQMQQWEATFDARTCPICGSYHGHRYPVGQGPPMPAHFLCRCTWIPVFQDPVLNDRLGTRKAYVTAQGKTRYKSADRSFEAWLRKQDANTQKDFWPSELKYRAWKTKRISLDGMVTQDGTVISDVELAHVLKDVKFVSRYRPDLYSDSGKLVPIPRDAVRAMTK